MKKINYICDICGQDATINYYTIQIQQHPDKIGRLTTAGAARNCDTFMRKLNDNEMIFCEECITNIEKFICEERKKQFNDSLVAIPILMHHTRCKNTIKNIKKYLK